MPFFSIIIPTYNRADLLPKAIKSVMDQTFTDWELIIVDDGSTDNTKEVVASFEDQRIKYIHQENAERSAARNKGIENAKGEFICFLDSDDWFLNSRLEKLHNAILQQNAKDALYFTDLILEHKGQQTTISYRDAGSQKFIDYIATNTIGTPQVCISRSILMAELFNERFSIGEDFELWVRIAAKFPVIYLSQHETVVALDHDDRSVNIRQNSAARQLEVLKYVFKQPHPGSKIKSAIKNNLLSNCFFNIAKHFMYNNDKQAARLWIRRSILKKLNHPQTKHRIYCLISLMKGKIPSEYQ